MARALKDESGASSDELRRAHSQRRLWEKCLRPSEFGMSSHVVCSMKKKTTFPTAEQLEQYMNNCWAATTKLHDKQIKEWHNTFQSHLRKIERKRDEMVRVSDLDEYEYKIGCLLYRLRNPTALDQLLGKEWLHNRIDKLEIETDKIEDAIDQALKPMKDELNADLQILEHAHANEQKELAKSLVSWRPTPAPEKKKVRKQTRNRAIEKDRSDFER